MSRTHIIQALTALPNIGERLATRMYEELGVRSVGELVDAAVTHRLQALRGIGSHREQQILEAARAAVVPDDTWELAAILRCPRCGHDGMELASPYAECPVCHREYSIEHGVVDLAPGGRSARSVTQRIMESRFYARFYEDVMRPRLTNVVTDRTLPEEYALATELLELDTAEAVLDVACGTGNFTRHFARQVSGGNTFVVGVDISWPMLETARAYLRREGLDDAVHLVRGDARRFPMKTEAFDRLHCAGALHIVEDIDGALAEFARLLEPGGICVVSTFVTGSGLLRRALKRVAEIPSRFHWFSPGELQRRMRGAGLTVVSESVDQDAITVKAFRD